VAPRISWYGSCCYKSWCQYQHLPISHRLLVQSQMDHALVTKSSHLLYRTAQIALASKVAQSVRVKVKSSILQRAVVGATRAGAAAIKAVPALIAAAPPLMESAAASVTTVTSLVADGHWMQMINLREYAISRSRMDRIYLYKMF
jgi:hypothetical protein